MTLLTTSVVRKLHKWSRIGFSEEISASSSPYHVKKEIFIRPLNRGAIPN